MINWDAETRKDAVLDVNVSKRLPGFTLDVRFRSGDGITTLFGKSGSGKSCIVNMLAGLMRPDHGRIALNGDVLFDSRSGVDVAPEKRRLGYVFQDSLLFPHMSVLSNLTYGYREKAARFSLDRIAGLLGLEALFDRKPSTLSGGERQRVAIGRAFLANPKLVLMDEPLASLDPERRDEILPFIEGLRDDLKLPIVYISHNIEEIVRLGDTAALVDAGRVVAAGPIEDLMSRLDLFPLTGRYNAGAVLPARVAGHDATFDLTELAVPGGTLFVPRLDAPVGARLRARIRARDVALALERPKDISMLNGFQGTIVEMADDGGPQIDVLIGIGADGRGAKLWARITRRSKIELGLAIGKSVCALVKTVALDRHSLSRMSRMKESPE